MKLSTLTRAGVLALAGAALLAGPAAASPERPSSGAVFVQTDDPAGNAVAAYDRGADGTLRPTGTYRTGGSGGVLAGSVVDHLASQGGLTYDRQHGLLYVVNAGSSTITVFGVDGSRLTRRQILPTGGNFPVSVTFHDNAVYVLNARDGGTIQGYARLGGILVPIPLWHRRLGLDPTQTPEFTHTPGQVGFTPDGHRLLVTTKANGNAVQAFDVDAFGGVSARPVTSALDGAVPFAFAFDVRGHLALTEAGPNAVATFALDRSGALGAPLAQALTGQAATCWIVADGTHFYVSNAGSGTISAYEDTGDGALKALGTTTTHAGTVDAVASGDGRFLYVQTGAAGIVDAYRVGNDGSLAPLGSVTVPGSIGSDGIAAS